MTHVRHIGSIESAYVKARQSCTSFKHTIHIRNLFGIKATYVKVRQLGTSGKHMTHVCHV